MARERRNMTVFGIKVTLSPRSHTIRAQEGFGTTIYSLADSSASRGLFQAVFRALETAYPGNTGLSIEVDTSTKRIVGV